MLQLSTLYHCNEHVCIYSHEAGPNAIWVATDEVSLVAKR